MPPQSYDEETNAFGGVEGPGQLSLFFSLTNDVQLRNCLCCSSNTQGSGTTSPLNCVYLSQPDPLLFPTRPLCLIGQQNSMLLHRSSVAGAVKQPCQRALAPARVCVVSSRASMYMRQAVTPSTSSPTRPCLSSPALRPGRQARRPVVQTRAFFDKIFKQDPSEKTRKQYQERVDAINALEPAMQALSDDQLRGKTQEFKQRVARGESLESLLPEAFAVSVFQLSPDACIAAAVAPLLLPAARWGSAPQQLFFSFGGTPGHSLAAGGVPIGNACVNPAAVFEGEGVVVCGRDVVNLQQCQSFWCTAACVERCEPHTAVAALIGGV